MKYLLLVLALQFTGLSFSIPRFTKLILTDLMSHPQSRFFVHLYLGMHGLIFNTSIWLLAGSTRYPIPTLYNSQTPQKAFLFCSSECFLTSCCAVALSQTLTPVLCKATNTPTTHQLSFHSQHHHYYVYHGVPTTTTLFPCFCSQVTHTNCVTHSTKARKEKA